MRNARGNRLDLALGFRVYPDWVPGLRISQLANRVGVATSTVRYYERVGLIPNPSRTPSGYRAYDDDARARLVFITRAKRLGLTLDEIRELMTVWDGVNCSATQVRMAALLVAKRLEIAEQIRELELFAEQLDEVHTALVTSSGPVTCSTDLQCCAPDLPEVPVRLLIAGAGSRLQP